MSGCHNTNCKDMIDHCHDGIDKCFEYVENIKDKLEERINKIEKKIEEFYDLMKIEDRITAYDVLCRLSMLESSEELIVLKMQVLEDKFKVLKHKCPYKCPVCNGQCGTKITGTIDEICNACEGKGIVWS